MENPERGTTLGVDSGGAGERCDDRLVFEVPGIPVPQGSMKGFALPTGGVALTSDNNRLRPWRVSVAWTAKVAYGPGWPQEGPISIWLCFSMPVPRSAPKRRRLCAVKKPDLDKLVRGVLDAMTGIVWRDDAQVVEITARKVLAYDRPPGLEVSVTWERSQGDVSPRQ